MIARKAAALTAVLAGSAYAALWIGVEANWSWLVAADARTLAGFHDFGSARPAWVGFWQSLSDLFSPMALRIAGVLAIGIALAKRRPRAAGFLALTVIPAGLVTATAKALSDRPRPQTALTHADSTAFPSGHALGITVAVLAVLILVWPRAAAPLRVALTSVGAALVFAVGLSRVALNVHHPSDVVAGWALGFLYCALCVLLAPPGVSGLRGAAARPAVGPAVGSDHAAGHDRGSVGLLGDRRQ